MPQATTFDHRQSGIRDEHDTNTEMLAPAQGDFARGQRHLATDGARGDFATGMRTITMLRVAGDFATGMRASARTTTRGDFATGMRNSSAPVVNDAFTGRLTAVPIAA